MYVNDYDDSNNSKINYMSTLINQEKMKIFEKVVYFKVSNGLTINLELSELLYLLCNFYYVRTVKISDGKFEEICINNYEPEMDRLFKSYVKKQISSWIILAEYKSILDKLKTSDNNISELNGVIFLKIKEYTGEISEYHATCEGNKTSDYRGIYENIDNKYVQQLFF
jgi:hypothetical protein